MATKCSCDMDDSDRDRDESSNRQANEPSADDVVTIWFDQNMDEMANADDISKTKTSLREASHYVLFFTKFEPFFNYIQSAKTEKVVLIISGAYAVQYLDKIHPLKQIDSVFIYCVYRNKYLPLKQIYEKIVNVLTEHDDLIESLMSTIDLITKQATVFCLFDSKQRSTRYLTRESASFLWFQLLTNVLQSIMLHDTENMALEEMIEHCRAYYRGNTFELNNIQEFKQNYKPEDAIFWYSQQTFLYRLVNKALRTEDIDALYTFRAYITHLRSQISVLHTQLKRQCCNIKSNRIKVYRGFKMRSEEIDQMRDNIGSLISMNGFFSTSQNIEQALRFAKKPSKRDNVIGVLFELHGDIISDKMVFADIAGVSAFPSEQEVLFDLATILKITHVEFDTDKNIWIIQLEGVNKSSYQINEYIKSIGKENEETNPTLLFGRLMCDMSEYEKSEKYLKRLLTTLPENHDDVSKVYFHLGRVYYLRGDYKQALHYYEQALLLQSKEIEPEENSLDIARTLHNIGNIYLDKNQITKALEYYEKALRMKRTLVIDDSENPTIATTLTAIGSIHRRRGNFKKALELYQQSYEIKKLSLPKDHPSLADTLNNLGIIHQDMDDTEQALECYRKSLEIKEKTLPPTHPSIGVTLNNMGIIHRKEGDYDKALVCYTQALEIEKATLSSDNLDLADTYNNLCVLYYDQKKFDKALEMAKLKLTILKRHFKEDEEQIKLARCIIDEINEQINRISYVNDSIETYF